MVAGAAHIRVTFEVDADGLLAVTATEQSSGVRAQVEVKPSYGLSDGEIETMLKESMSHARDDMEARKLREEQVEAERAVEALGAALAQDGERLLNAEERALIDHSLGELEKVLDGDDPKAIAAAVKALEQTCGFYVERRMNAGIQRAMAGHKVEEFE